MLLLGSVGSLLAGHLRLGVAMCGYNNAINHPLGFFLNHPLMAIWGMVYDCLYLHELLCGGWFMIVFTYIILHQLHLITMIYYGTMIIPINDI